MKTKIAILLLACFSSFACVKEDINRDTGTRMVKLSVSVPASTTVSDWSRAAGANLYHIENLSVFVANADGYYQGRYEPTVIFPENESQTQWTVIVPLPEMQGKVTIHVVANFNDFLPSDIDHPSITGKLISEVVPAFIDTRPDPNAPNYGAIVMWGLIHMDGISADDDTTIPVRLIRNVSSVRVDFDPEIINAGIFEFERLILYNVKKSGTVSSFPFPADMEETTLLAMTKATEPTTGEIGMYEGETGMQELFCYSRQNQTWQPKLDRNECMFVILKGKYKNSNDPGRSCYYRIELATKGGTSEDPIFEAQEIMRNHRYGIYVNEISGPGYDTVEEAIKYPSSNNINTVLTGTPVEEITDLISNGQYKVGMSRSNVVLYGEPQQDDTEWFEVCKVYGVAPLVKPEDLTVGELPTLDDLVCTVRDNSDGLLLEDGFITGPDGKQYVKTEYHHAEPVTSSYKSILVKRTRCQDVMRTAQTDIKVGNLERVITISQSKNQNFEIPPVVYVGWKSNLAVEIPIKVAEGTTGVSNLECAITLENAPYGFLTHKDNVQSVTLVNEHSEVNAVLSTSSSYYAKSEEFYRTQKVTVSAEGFNPAEVLVKQSKFLDGIYGSAIVGIMRGDNETEIYTTSFGNSEERWSAKVVQGEEFIRLGTAHSGVAEQTEIGSNTTGNIGFDYRLLQNTTGKKRFGKIEVTYAKEQWVHTIYVCQGMGDIPVTFNGITTYWAAGNTICQDGDMKLAISRSTSYPGAMFKFGDMTYTPYSPTEPSWGLNYTPSEIVYTAGWKDVSGNKNNYSIWNPCPEGYRLPTGEEYKVWAIKIAGEKAGEDEVTGKPYQKVVWGRVSNGNTDLLRPGMLYVFLDADGGVVNMFFLAAAGVRSETYGRNSGIPYGNGRLLYGHYAGNPEDPANNFGNQGGGYWYRLSSYPGGNIQCIDMYHDPNNNIGLDVLNSGGANWLVTSENDAMAVRCVRE